MKNRVSKTKLFHLFVFLILLLAPNLFAQNSRNKLERFTHLEEISQNTIRCIMQDSKGFMWFGTENGLNRYDGYNFVVYKHDPENEFSLCNSSILSMYEDSDGYLWVGTNGGGLDRFDRRSEKFTCYKEILEQQSGISVTTIRSIYEDNEGYLWFGTDENGLYRFDRKNDSATRFEHDPDKPGSLTNNRIWAISENSSDELLVGTYGGGLNVFDKEKETFSVYTGDLKTPEGWQNKYVRSILEDKEGRLWIGTNRSGVYRFDIKNKKIRHYRHSASDPKSLSYNRIRTIYEDVTGTIWIGTIDGLNKYNGENDSYIHYKDDPGESGKLSNKSIWSVFEDRSGVLWVGTIGGLNKYNRLSEKFELYQHNIVNSNSLSNNRVRSICEGNEGIFWIGTDYGGLNKFDRKNSKFTHYRFNPDSPASISSNRVRAICKDRFGKLWVGTYGGGLNKFNPNTKKFTHFVHNPKNPFSLSNDRVQALIEDSEGNLWIGTYGGGLNRFDRQKKRFTAYRNDPENPNSLSSDRIWTLFEDRSGYIWIGTVSGLNRFNPDTEVFTVYKNIPSDNSSISNNSIRAVIEDVSGKIWVATNGGGLNLFDRDKETFLHFAEKDGLPSNTIIGIVEDELGNLWLSTNNGLSKFNVETKTFTNFNKSDGLQENEFKEGAYFKSRSGEIFFGGINGFNVFLPEKTIGNPIKPDIVITDFQILNRSVIPGEESILKESITTTENIKVSTKMKVISFEFAALHYVIPEKNQYAYYLEGFDSEINYIGNRRFVTFTNLSHGSYTLKVFGSNSDGLWNKTGASLDIIVIPPFWQTYWFIILAVCFVIAIIFILYKLRIRVIESQHRKLELLVNEKTKALSVEREKLFSLNLDLEIEITDRERAENITQALYSISKAVNESHNLDELYIHIHKNLEEIIDLTNFFIALYNEKDDVITFPYFKDERDNIFKITNASKSGSLSFEVLSKNRPLILNKVQIASRYSTGERIQWGTLAKIWVGVPLSLKDEIIGVIGVQSYTDPDLYTQKDIELLESVSDQIASAIIQKKAEDKRKKLEEQLIQAQKMESIGRLAGGIAHDFNNILTGILGFAELLKLKHSDPNSSDGQAANIIMKGAERASVLTQQLLGFARGGKYNPVPLNINDVIEETVQVSEKIFDKNINVTFDFDEQINPIEADRNQLNQIFTNLLINAKDALPGGGQIKFLTENMTIDEEYSRYNPEFVPGDYVRITVQDNGIGMPKEVMSHVFEPFFTTKGKGKGTGLGLATVYGIVKNHNGFVDCASQPGKGTMFTLYFAVTDKEIKQEKIIIEASKGEGMILVVDDEEHIRTLAKELLTELNYDVLLAGSGEEAINVLKENRNKIDLILLDIIMPEMDGRATNRELKKIDPDVKVLVSSGYDKDGKANEILSEGAVGFLQKPYLMHELSTAVGEILSAKT